MWLCTPPSLVSPMMCSVVLRSFTESMIRVSTGLRPASPSTKAAVIRMRSCRMTRPAPMHMWPTSELPICPGGSPTAVPEASRSVAGYRAASEGMCTAPQLAMALPSRRSLCPQPSREISTRGSMRSPPAGNRSGGAAVDGAVGEALVFEGCILGEVRHDLVPFAADRTPVHPRRGALVADLAAIVQPQEIEFLDDLAVGGGGLAV